MAYEHESGLPNAYDRAAGRPDMQGVVHYGERRFIQGAELNEAQTIQRNRLRRVGKLIASDGDRVERGQALVDVEAGTVTIEAGKVYADGDVWDIPARVLSDVPMVGRVEVGIRLVTSYVTSEEDPTLKGMVPGSLAEGEPGAAREIRSAFWSWAGDGADGVFYSSYILHDGVILDQEGPNILAPALQALRTYDQANGNYIVSGCKVTALGADAGAQRFAISEGEANINGYKRTRYAALRHNEPEIWDELAIPGETHVIEAGASFKIVVAKPPISAVSSILLTKEVTETVTRGAVAHGADGLVHNSIVSVSAVVQGAATYIAGIDFNRINNTIDWAPAGDEPAAGSTYQVTYRYRDAIIADEITLTEIVVSGGAEGGDAIVAYTQRLPRIDRLCLAEDGSPLYLKGISASQPVAPLVPKTALKLATIANTWDGVPTVQNDGTHSLPWDALWPYLLRVVEQDRLLQLERLKSGIDSKEPVAKKGMFVDPFVDDTYRDAGQVQTGAISDGMLVLAIEPTFYDVGLRSPVTLDWVEEVIISQQLKTACEKINPYANFTPLPAALVLDPPVDFWTVSKTQWLSAQTTEFNRGVRRDGGPLVTSSTTEELVDTRTEQLEFLRSIPVKFEIDSFGIGEILAELTFDEVDVLPAEPLVGDADGKLSGNFVIPEGVTAGSKVVAATGQGGTEATGLFTGQGSVEINVMRQVTTVNRWSRPVVRQEQRQGGGSDSSNDPQAQMFAVPELRQVLGFDFHLCAIGDQGNNIIVDQVTIDNGYPTADIQAEAFVSMAGAVTGWTPARFQLPLSASPEVRHAFVIKTDDSEHSVSVAQLGGFDAELQQRVTTHPYVTGPRFSSVNAQTWTAHQDEALAFRVIAASYPVTTKTVDLGEYDLVDCSDLQVRAAVELPSAGCSVEFEIERTNGTIYRLQPGQVLQLTEFITETVELRAVLTGTTKLSPVLYSPVQLVAGKILSELTYITRSFELGEAVRVASYFKAYLPGGSSVTMDISIDGGPWTPMPLEETEALSFPLWTERKHELTDLTGTLASLRITGTGGPASRLAIGDLGAGIF